jgi:DNA-binding transcriptional ArsR family regulator
VVNGPGQCLSRYRLVRILGFPFREALIHEIHETYGPLAACGWVGTMAGQPPLVKVTKAAAQLGVSRSTVVRHLPVTRVGGALLVSQSAIDRLLPQDDDQEAE